ncbi:MAG: hypothetical protein WCE64_10310 [Bacteroidales bacterium]
MNAEEIKKLLEKYYEAATTPEEEQALKNFFSQGPVPDELKPDKEIFVYYLGASEIPEPSAGFEDKIISSALRGDSIHSLSRKGRISLITGIAAGLLILVASYFFLTKKQEPRDTYSDPRIAYAETMKVLYDISVSLNEGTNALKPVGMINDYTEKSINALNKPSAVIEKNLKPLDQLGRMEKNISEIEKSNTKNK